MAILLHQGNYIETSDRKVRIISRMDRSCIAILDDLFSKEECEALINLSRDKLQRSATIDPNTGEEMIIEERTSWGTFFELNENDFIAQLDRRIYEVMNWPIENGEGLQILNYKIGADNDITIIWNINYLFYLGNCGMNSKLKNKNSGHA